MSREGEKFCRTCGEWRPFSAFYKDSYAPDGYRPVCKPCRRAQRALLIAGSPPSEKLKHKDLPGQVVDPPIHTDIPPDPPGKLMVPASELPRVIGEFAKVADSSVDRMKHDDGLTSTERAGMAPGTEGPGEWEAEIDPGAPESKPNALGSVCTWCGNLKVYEEVPNEAGGTDYLCVQCNAGYRGPRYTDKPGV